MIRKLQQLWIDITSSFWFIPALINLFLFILALLIIQIDQILASMNYPFLSKYFKFRYEDLRVLLGTVAGSMITITGVVFSITILVLAQTAGQYTSRVLRNFMRNRLNQISLGIFVGIFVFCLLLLTNLDPINNTLTTLAGFIMTLVGVGFLIFFIHHTSVSIQATEIIQNIHKETLDGINRIYPNPFSKRTEKIQKREYRLQIPCTDTGYIQSLDLFKAQEIAKKYRIFIHVKKKVGDFVSRNEPICEIEQNQYPGDTFCSEINSAIFIGKNRNALQDVSFGIQQLVDLTLKALSPASNDFTTVQVAIDYLGDLFIELCKRDLGAKLFFEDHKPILEIETQTFDSLLRDSFGVIIEGAKMSKILRKKVKENLEKVKMITPCTDRKKMIASFLTENLQ